MTTLSLVLCHDPSVLADPRAASALLGRDAIILPELVDGGYARLDGGGAPHEEGDRVLQEFRALSRRLSTCLIAGSVFLQGSDGKRTNTSLVFVRGRRVHRYDKIHLFRPCGDHRYFRPGVSAKVFAFGLGTLQVRAGVVICYDLRFPELIRLLALRGMQILFVPARWPAVRDDAWRTLLKARAIENQLFVVGCNALGPEGGVSYVFDPSGREELCTRDDSGRLFSEVVLELGRIEEAHATHRNLREAVVLRGLTGGVSRRLQQRIGGKKQ